MPEKIKLLYLEDNPDDIEITSRFIEKELPTIEIRVAVDKTSYIETLYSFQPDLVLSDHSLLQFNSIDALDLARQKFPDIPFIILTGAVSEEFAMEIMKSGADDFILKDRLTRLPSAIDKALKFRKNEIEKKEIQRKISESESNLRAIFENTSEGFLLMDTNGLVKTFNRNAAKYGYFIQGKEIEVGDRLIDFIEDSRKSIFKELLSKVFQKENVKYERVYENEDGSKRWIDFSMTPVIENEKITGICITGLDITNKKLAAQEKEFDHNNLSALINNTQDLMWSVDKNLKLLTCNESFDKAITHLAGKTTPKGGNILASNFSEEQLRRYKTFYKRALSGETFTVTDHLETPVELWSEISFNAIYSNEEVVGAACFSHDITQRRKGEQERKRLISILESTPDFVGIADINQHVIYLNRGAREMLGYGENEDLTGKPIREFLDYKSYKRVSEKSLPVALTEGKWSGELNLVTKEGEEVSVSIGIVVHTTPEGQPEYLSTIGRDISDRKKAEINLKLMEQKILNEKIAGQKKIARAILQAQEKERNHLGQELHDNINQILAATKLHLDIARRDNPELKRLVQYPIELISSAIAEIRQLSSRQVTPLKNIDLKDLIAKIIEEFKQNPSIKMDFIFNVSSHVKDDELKLNIYRITQEQLNNILKHAKAKNVSIVIESSGKNIHIQVADDGIGFDLKKKRKGIGISNMMNRIESFNGKMKVKTSPGNGCRTDIFIPF